MEASTGKQRAPGISPRVTVALVLALGAALVHLAVLTFSR